VSLDKAIKHGKEHRKPYRGAKAIDACCRNHGVDTWSLSNRTIQSQKELEKMKVIETNEEDLIMLNVFKRLIKCSDTYVDTEYGAGELGGICVDGMVYYKNKEEQEIVKEIIKQWKKEVR